VSRVVVLSVLVSSLSAVAAEESAAFCPLAVEPGPQLNAADATELQKKFLAVAKERAGYSLALRGEVDAAMQKAKVVDLTRDAELAKVATGTATKNAGAFSLKLTESGDLLLTGRIVSAEGKLLKSSMVSVPRNGETLVDALARGAAKFFDALNGVLPAEPLKKPTLDLSRNGEPTGSAPTPPPLVFHSTEPPNPGTPLRIAGVVLAAGGVAASVTGVVLFATSGTVQKDANGNVAVGDLPKIGAIRTAQGAGMGALTAGVALGITGALMIALAPNAPVTASIAPTREGGLVAVGGTF